MELDIIRESIEEVAERRMLSFSKSQELIDQLSREIEQALRSMQSDDDPTTVVTQLKAKLQALVSDNHLEGPYQEADASLSQSDEHHDTMLIPDMSNPLKGDDFHLDPHTINQIIIRHLYSKGLFDIADCFINEAHEPEPTPLKLQFQEIHHVLNALKAKNIKPALNWITANKERLGRSHPDIELKLHKTHFLNILQTKGRDAALAYVRNSIAPLASHHMKEIQKMMGSLLWAGKLENSPYRDWLDPTHLDRLIDELFCAFCNLKGQPCTDPLEVSVAAGGEALPKLLKTKDVVARDGQ